MGAAKAKVTQRSATPGSTPIARGLVYMFTALSVAFAVVAYAFYW